MKDIDEYIQDQINIEIEHIRSWPTKVMAFYVAFSFAIISVVIALQKFDPPVQLSCRIKTDIMIIILFVAFYILYTLWNLNDKYAIQRELQIDLQTKLFKDKQEDYSLPKFWFEKKRRWSCIKYPGWLIYVCLLVLITFLVVKGIFIIGESSKANIINSHPTEQSQEGDKCLCWQEG